MRKSILNLGKALNKAEQKIISGGGLRSCSPFFGACRFNSDCCTEENDGYPVHCINRVCIPT
ncbi:hypothetical protein P8625_06830 [Tenacibaculum tangerinum]|uniref:Bacteriocin n=1 Tax=Tenacibaculum tangerinum TaxID=3038772 RepID=A0ABY8LA18_9FLAO|nr:hypothetical protein [Tenacibaculum tangerinum]WGH76850.1 hypothetical protein P8625_06830 [Tenacibaculum tangerinum]